MTLHINDPKFFKERSESKPLSLEEQNHIVFVLNWMLEDYEALRKQDHLQPVGEETYHEIQRLLYQFENLQALSDFIGGWEGANRLMNVVDPMPDKKEIGKK